MITLRQATQDDLEPLWHFHCDTMREYVEPIWGWVEAEQRVYFLNKFAPTQIQVIERDGSFVGILRVDRHSDHTYISSIQVLPPCQGSGVGSAIIRQVLDQAQAEALPVRLQVLRSNPARALYERLGFSVCGETENHVQMKWVPCPTM